LRFALPAAAPRYLGAALFALGLALGARAVRADSNPAQRAEAKLHYERANELVLEGAFEAAAIEFRKAYEIAPRFEVLYNLGQAYVALGRAVEAADTLSRYLAEGGTRVDAARRAEVDKEIQRQTARIAQLTLSIEPPSATVTLDGEPLAPDVWRQPLRVTLGTHRIAVTAPHYLPKLLTVTAAGGEHRTISVRLEPPPAPLATPQPTLARLAIECAVPDVELLLDGKPLGRTPFRAALKVPSGAHGLRFGRQGYKPVERLVTLEAGSTDSIDCGMEASDPLPEPMAARLAVTVSEPDAKLELDGRPFKSGSWVPWGRHILRVQRLGFHVDQREVVAPARTTTAVLVQLTPTREFAREYRASARTRRVFAYVTAGAGLAVGAVALGVYFDNNSRQSEWEKRRDALDRDRANVAGTPAAAQLEPAFDERQRENDRRAYDIVRRDSIAIGSGIVGGALVAAGAVLYFTGDDPDRYGDVVASLGTEGAALLWSRSW
jgi:hypothetical protein